MSETLFPGYEPAVRELRPNEHAAFYAEHYSDWTVHALSLTVYVPVKNGDRDFALSLVREVLDDAAFDIRVSEHIAPLANPADHTPRAEQGGESEEGS